MFGPGLQPRSSQVNFRIFGAQVMVELQAALTHLPVCIRQIHILRLGPQTGRGRRSLGKLPHEAAHEESSGREKERETRVVVVQGMKTSEEVTGLRLYSHYQLTVTAFNSKGDGPHSHPHHFSTPEGGEFQEVGVSRCLYHTS